MTYAEIHLKYHTVAFPLMHVDFLSLSFPLITLSFSFQSPMSPCMLSWCQANHRIVRLEVEGSVMPGTKAVAKEMWQEVKSNRRKKKYQSSLPCASWQYYI